MSEYSNFVKELNEKIKNYKIDSSNPLFINSILTINDEVLNSSIIGWILHLNDGNGTYWLLNEFLERASEKSKHARKYINKPPLNIIKEQSTISGKRLDIIVRWSDFVLIIENKTKSQEHDSQCETYLKDNQLYNPHLIYLTINGESPESIASNSDWENDFTDLSYRKLFNCLNNVCKKVPEDFNQFYIDVITDYMLSLQYLLKSGMVIENNTLKKEINMKDVDKNITWLFKKENKQKLDNFIKEAKKVTQDFMIEFQRELTIKIEEKFGERFEEAGLAEDSLFFYKKDWTSKYISEEVDGETVEINTGYQFLFKAANTKIENPGYKIIGEREYESGIRLMNLQFEGKKKLPQKQKDLWTASGPKKRNIISAIQARLIQAGFGKLKLNNHVVWAYYPEDGVGFVEFSNVSEKEKWVDETMNRFIKMIEDTYPIIEKHKRDIFK